MFADRGYEAVTLRAIAKEIGYTHAVIYQHFPDKWHILAELSSETIGLLIQNFDAIAAKHPAPKERLFATSRGLIQFCTAHPQQFRNVFFGPENRNGIRAGQYINDIGTPLFQRFVQLFFDVAKDEGLPSRDDIVVAHTWWYTIFGIATLIGLVVGIIPALHASRSDPQSGLRQSSRTTAGRHEQTRRTLVVAEIALALVLLVSAGLLLRSLERLFAVAPGFDSSHLLTMQVQTSGHRFDDVLDDVENSTRHRFFAQALHAVRDVPGVAAAGFSSLLPLSGDQFGEYGVQFENDNLGGGYNVFRYVVTSGYIETMGIALRRGRLLDDRDVASAPPAVLISESLAKRKFRGQDPIGQRVHVGPLNRPWFTIVGVVGDVKQTSLALSQPDAVYITTDQSWFVDDALSLVVRTRGDAAVVAPAIRKAIWSADKDQPIVRVATMDDLLTASAAERRFALILFEAFGIAALVLAATGIYGVLSGSVTERMREIGLRSALGATRGNILALVVRQGMILTGIGVVIGLSGAAAASRALVTLLFGVSRLDPITYLAVTVLLACVSVIACWVPAWRAARVDPCVTLRAE